jgi:hypothetical protein
LAVDEPDLDAGAEHGASRVFPQEPLPEPVSPPLPDDGAPTPASLARASGLTLEQVLDMFAAVRTPRRLAAGAQGRELLRMRFDERLPTSEIARRVGISPVQASHAVRAALTRMRTTEQARRATRR